ncbi:hypothetical protein BS78_03G201100 [Paspalum vaginatum]|nr:hypothetical protein BS78_03G201100 [Paspalum vaginatum]
MPLGQMPKSPSWLRPCPTAKSGRTPLARCDGRRGGVGTPDTAGRGRARSRSTTTRTARALAAPMAPRAADGPPEDLVLGPRSPWRWPGAATPRRAAARRCPSLALAALALRVRGGVDGLFERMPHLPPSALRHLPLGARPSMPVGSTRLDPSRDAICCFHRANPYVFIRQNIDYH